MDPPPCRKCGHVGELCPQCLHHWSEHDARFFYNCAAPKEGGDQYQNCGCEYTLEQAEVAHARVCSRKGE